jgi:hypothetical protein
LETVPTPGKNRLLNRYLSEIPDLTQKKAASLDGLRKSAKKGTICSLPEKKWPAGDCYERKITG